LTNLEAMSSQTIEGSGDLDDMQYAIKHGEDALSTTPHDHPDREMWCNNLGQRLSKRFKQMGDRIGDVEDLHQAIKYGEDALAATPHDHPDRVMRYNNQGQMLLERFKRIGDVEDLHQAIKHGKDALAATPHDHPDRARWCTNLGQGLLERFERMGDVGDLHEAIKYTEDALAATPHDYPDRAMWCNNLTVMLLERFERMGDVEDLHQAIKHGEDALEATPHDHASQATLCNNLGQKLAERFKRIGDVEDLHQAIKHGKDALAATPHDHPDRALWCNNLGEMLSQRFKRMGDVEDLHQAIKYTEDALAATPHDHPGRPILCNNLGEGLLERFKLTGDVEDLQQAIKHGEDALETTPHDHPNQALWCYSLGQMLLERFKRIGDVEDQHQAIKYGEDALAATPHDHPDRAMFCNNLGASLESRLSALHPIDEFNECVRLYSEAWRCLTSPPSNRIHAALQHARLLNLSGNFQESSVILEDAVNLIPNMNLRFLKRDDQQHKLSELSGLATTASSVMLQAGREAYDSLKLLELGRGTIMGFAIDSRSDLSDLKRDHRSQFDIFHRLRVEIDSPLDGVHPISTETLHRRREGLISQRKEAVDKLEKTLIFIRSLPGYSGFLLPPSPDILREMSENGPIVVLNSTQYRSDAIIVTTSTITSLELPSLKLEDIEHRMDQLAEFGREKPTIFRRRENNLKMNDFLHWLWDTAVGPVLDELQRCGAISTGGVGIHDLTRVWWIGVGPLSMAPFHAAGYHSPGSTRNTLSRVISTYIPTIKALSYARQKQFALFGGSHTRLLLVSMPKTPGASNLPGASQEVQYISDETHRFGIETSVLREPTPTAVLDQVAHFNFVHLACHGVSGVNPSDSHLLLLSPDGANAAKLRVRDISALNTQNSHLAYLSACSSAQNSSLSLADEVIHLASGFQLAGFSHVLANLWETNDSASSEVARDFYHLLFQNHGTGDWHYRVAASFHEAVKRLRDKRPQNPLTWAPFIHTGA
ncbi:TPR-like protein, partial [Choiromyces venosus 120613-1]